MNNLPRRTLILYICGGIVLLGAIYYYGFYNRDSGSAVVNSDVTASAAEISFITLVGQIDPITFDVSILSNPRFAALQDIRTAVLPEAQGRKDPFAVFSGGK
jgi:hypothetical protein